MTGKNRARLVMKCEVYIGSSDRKGLCKTCHELSGLSTILEPNNRKGQSETCHGHEV